MNANNFRAQKNQNLLHTGALLLGMFLLLLLMSSFFLDTNGLILAGVVLAGMLFFLTRIPTEMVMRMQGGRPLSPHQVPNLSNIMIELARRAGLSRVPQLYYIPHRALNAFATGNKQDPAIGLTHGILQQLNLRELTGVLAHEISHIRNNDLKLNALMNLMARLTRFFAFVGQILLIINFPLYLMGDFHLPWPFILLLIGAPYLSMMLTLAFSRTREFAADLEAARLTGDPLGLAGALEKLNFINERGMQFFSPLRKITVPKALRSHPTTRARVNRLRDLASRYKPSFNIPAEQNAPIPTLSGWRRYWYI